MNQFILTAPGKTFFLGEYAVLDEGVGLLCCTKPQFKLIVKKDFSGEFLGVHPDSPAGLWVRQNQWILKDFHLEFRDPHLGRGGFGASTAQFLLVYIFHRLLLEDGLLNPTEDFQKKMREDFWSVAWSGKGLRPSGVDLLAQYFGSICLVQSKNAIAENFEWPFSDKDFLILRTNAKLSTHLHLESLESLQTNQLKAISQKGVQAVQQKNWPQFVSAINDYRVTLGERGLTAPRSIELLDEIVRWAEIEACKACGAAGMDTLVLFFDSNLRESVKEKVRNLDLEIIGGKLNIGQGVQMYAGGEEMKHFGELNV